MTDDLKRILRRARLGPRYVEKLAELGERRRAALDEAESCLRRLEELLPEALEAGLTLTEIAKLGGVSRPTLYAWRQGKAARPGMSESG